MTLPERMIRVETKLDDIKEDVTQLKKILVWGVAGTVIMTFVSGYVKDALSTDVPHTVADTVTNSLVAMLKNLF